MPLAGDLVYIRHFASSSPAGNIVFVKPDFDTAPCVFVVGFWAGNYEVCAETCCREARGAFYFGHLALDVADGGEVDEVEGILLPIC